MLKRFSKFLLIILVMFVISSSSLVCLADEEHDHEHTNTTTSTQTDATQEQNTSEESKIHNGDLYLFDNNIVMDKYVDGNAFLFGNNIEVTGQVNGNLFVFGTNVKFNESVVRYSIFVCANSVYYNGGCGTEYDYGNLYVAASHFESTYNSYITGDIKAVASSVILKSAVYRDVDLISNNINLGNDTDVPVIYGNLNYTSNKEITVPENVLAGNGKVTYTSNFSVESITEILIGFGICIVTTLVLFIILNKFAPCFIQKVSDEKFSLLKVLKTFVIGLATIIIVSIFVILLAGTTVGVSIAAILALIFAIICIIAQPTLSIKITNTLKPILKIEKTYIFYLIISLVSIILHGITLIPFVGSLFGLIINITGIGLITSVFLPHKELSEEEKLALEEVKKASKENKEKRKQEKLEAKLAKKEEKQNKKQDNLKSKEVKKEDKKTDKEIE